MHAVRLLGVLFPPRCNGVGEVIEHSDGALPVNAGICDGDALLERAGTFGWDLLVALVDVGLDHDGDDAGLALAELIGDDLCDLGLVAVVLVGVAYITLGFLEKT